MKYDVIIAGAGIAGSACALKISQAGFTTALLDLKSLSDIGGNWSVSFVKSALSYLGLKIPDAKTIIEQADETVFYAGDLSVSLCIKNLNPHMITLKHAELNRYLLKNALERGVIFFPECEAVKPVLENNRCIGLAAEKKNLFLKSSLRLHAKIIIDCTGTAGVLRKNLPPETGIETGIELKHYASAWEETWSIKPGGPWNLINNQQARPGVCYTRLGKYHGFSSYFLRHTGEFRIIYGAGADDNAFTRCRNFTDRTAGLAKRLASGGNIIPIRRSLDQLCTNGFLAVGNAACQVIPTMGSGVEASLQAAAIASSSVIGALNNHDFSTAGLWTYSAKYQKKLGAILASYDIVRLYLQKLSMEDFDQVLKSGLINSRDFAGTYSTSDITRNLAQIIEKIRKALSSPKIIPMLLRLEKALYASQRVLDHYRTYPELYNASKLESWKKRTEKFFNASY
ncbi:MAG: hypothetical protein A2096_06945 [Spirochaetes bacterium GWF1_41_5]|nr:MAG: hypothetical protein A2096_06945 [Spirochaetes bacterium GWF1_41_5]HBE04423.1 hypothetical protein [Spirochaetia bacterium]